MFIFASALNTVRGPEGKASALNWGNGGGKLAVERLTKYTD